MQVRGAVGDEAPALWVIRHGFVALGEKLLPSRLAQADLRRVAMARELA
ncbi:hypothetical protein EDF73_112142 [Raoultella sp. BIGb0138]|nr:hypothetical protein [Raoultella sp. BIGb0138]TCW07810.1 hypothetical protein EDF73_112142 [Raoultella sp. BIGb0138]